MLNKNDIIEISNKVELPQFSKDDLKYNDGKWGNYHALKMLFESGWVDYKTPFGKIINVVQQFVGY